MIQSYTALTHEVDDVELAVAEVLEQLPALDALRKNTIGIITCFAEYLDTGVVAALTERLPFELVGITTIANAAPHEIGETMLNLLVMTSDDVAFAAGLSDPLDSEDPQILHNAYAQAAATLPDKPALILSFAPLTFNVSVDFLVSALDTVSGGIPNFGPIAVDHNEDYCQAQVISNGKGYKNRYGFILLSGSIHPSFYVGNISSDRFFPEKGVVTAAQANQLQTVNGKPLVEYLLSLGLTKDEDGTLAGINTFPIIVDYNDGTSPIARAMFALTPEGYAVCGGAIPVGSTLAVGAFDAAEIESTSTFALEQALQAGGHSTYFIYSCIGRYFAQGANQLNEIEAIKSQMEQAGASYIFSYSGSEICPVYDKDHTTHNRNHNNSIIICAI